MGGDDDIGAAIRAAAAGVQAPDGLRERVAAQRTQARRRDRRRSGLLGGAAGVLVATVVALAITLPGGAPTVADAADVALAAPTATAPAAVPGTPRLAASVGEVAFPDWSAIGWRAVGQRSEEVSGRATRTVFYESAAGRRLGYTIVAGEPLAVPDGTVQRRNGTAVTLLRRDGATVATWRQGGHTCVLAAASVSAKTLVGLAAGRPY